MFTCAGFKVIYYNIDDNNYKNEYVLNEVVYFLFHKLIYSWFDIRQITSFIYTFNVYRIFVLNYLNYQIFEKILNTIETQTTFTFVG